MRVRIGRLTIERVTGMDEFTATVDWAKLALVTYVVVVVDTREHCVLCCIIYYNNIIFINRHFNLYILHMLLAFIGIAL